MDEICSPAPLLALIQLSFIASFAVDVIIIVIFLLCWTRTSETSAIFKHRT